MKVNPLKGGLGQSRSNTTDLLKPAAELHC